MITSIRRTNAALLTAMLAGALLALPQISLAARAGATAIDDSPNAAAAAGRLEKPQFKDVKVAVDEGLATLTGTVDLFQYKADAGKRVLKAKGVTAVRNLIVVGGPSMSDRDLEDRLRTKLSYDRALWGNQFNSVGVSVENGVVTVGGHARTEVDRDSAMAAVTMCPGVKEVVGKIDVDPVSPFDDEARIRVARAIYGYPTLSKYGMDPAMPIRISVQHGNVELYGTVDSQVDKQVAFMQANTVPGVFSVKNYLQVAGQASESHK